MSEQTAKVKRADHNILCVTCGQPLPKPKRVKKPKAEKPKVISMRKIFMAAILDALVEGPATSREIAERLGFIYAKDNSFTSFLDVHERKGRVVHVGYRVGKRARAKVWALPEVKA